MPTNLTGRFLLIGAVLFGCLYILFPFAFTGNFTPNIRPGIDMVGGSSLVYPIKVPPGQTVAPDLADRVITALRQRVDPDGVKNLVWRANGAEQIEIQLPATKDTEAAKPAREAFANAQSTIDSMNVHPPQVAAALDRPAAERDKTLTELAAGSTQRDAIFKRLIQLHDKLEAARGKDAAAEAEARVGIDKAMAELPTLNVELRELETATELTDAKARDAKVAELIARDPAYADAIHDYVKSYDGLQAVKDTVGDVAELKRLLRGSGVLTFHICAKIEDAGATEVTRMVEQLQKEGPRGRATDRLVWIVNDRDAGSTGRNTIAQPYNGKTYLLCWNTRENSLRNREGEPHWALESAQRQQDQSGAYVVAFNFDAVGADLFGKMTGKHTPDSPGGPYDLAAVLDNKVISNASLSSAIGAHGQITGGGKGGFSPSDLDYLVKTLSAGSLPAQLAEEPIVERTVGPQLGADNLHAGFIACGFGVGVVAIFLVSYYYLAGCVALIAMAINLVLILAGMSALGATFTLPGVAGIILTIGMAVDANVLIFERLREEQHRGLSLRVAMRQAYFHARTAILDSNVTAAITGIILYMIGTEDVKGFGLTLLLGILSSLFTALFVTKTIFAVLIDKFGVEDLSSIPLTFPRWEKFLHPKIDWIGKAWMFVAFSAVFIAIGSAVLVMKFREGRVLDIEFAGGTIVQFNLKQPMAQEDVRRLIEHRPSDAPGTLDAPGVQSVGDSAKTPDGRTGFKSYEVVTVTTDVPAVRAALSSALAGDLDVAQASTFVGAGKAYNDVQRDASLIVPITSETQNIAGFVPRSVADHVGGVAIVIHNLTPKLDATDVRQRITQQRAAAGGSFKKYNVEALPDGTGLVVLASDATVAYKDTDAEAVQNWSTTLAAPTWDRVNEAITNPAEFARVSKINETVAGNAATDAIIALITSVVLIVIYVWVRFGDLKFGSATVVALAHDVAFMVASIGIAHLLAGTFVGRALLLEPFRINMTMVSAILAIIGFSMSDTVVIFDRIRENRDKIGHLDRNIINASINQTLGRTLLMGVTTLATLLVMYITGGEAIHGFTFALFFGLLTGVYSSVAIASPLILVGGHKTVEQKSGLPVAKPAL